MEKKQIEWRPIKEYEGQYEVSDKGEIKSMRKRNSYKILKPRLNRDGYLYVNLSKTGKSVTMKVHRLVGQSFLQNSEGKCCINHKDGNKQNNELINIEWVTSKENIEHAIKSGLCKFRKILDECSGMIFNSIKEASEFCNINYWTLKDYLTGRIKRNPTCLTYISLQNS